MRVYTTRACRLAWAGFLFTLIAGDPLNCRGDENNAPRKGARRAALPEFDRSDLSDIFFADVFARLRGERPQRAGNGQDHGARPLSAPAAPEPGFAWSNVISSSALEDEIKASRLAVEESLTSGSAFASRGHSIARSHFSLLAVLFTIVDQYDKDVRFKHSASTVRDRLSRYVRRASGAEPTRVYTTARELGGDLRDLLGGSRLVADVPSLGELPWGSIADRSVLMKRLETAFRARLQPGVRDARAIGKSADVLVHEAQIVAVIAHVLADATMEDGDDPDYTIHALSMKSAAAEVKDAVRRDDTARLQSSVTAIGQACTRCHDTYR